MMAHLGSVAPYLEPPIHPLYISTLKALHNHPSLSKSFSKTKSLPKTYMEFPLLNYHSFELQWLYLEHRFHRFEESLAIQNSPQHGEAVNMNGMLPDSDRDCTTFNYLNDDLLTVFDDVVFPDIDMFKLLPPLEQSDDYYEAEPFQLNGTSVDDKVDVGKELVVFCDHEESVFRGGGGSSIRARSWARTKSDDLEFEDVQKLFDRPILEAAKELRVGLTLLKKRCRELGIRRWPHRKLRSLKSLILNVKELGMDKEVNMLEEQRKMLVEQREMELNDRAKKIRQKSFKANHMRKRKNKASFAMA